MARTPRRDAAYRFHHIMNRAARRQVLFADQRDYRYFLALLACSVRRGEIIIQAYCLLGTHFHLLAASPEGNISYAMMRIQNAYARYRNRRSRLDGPLFRGRFRSKPVLSWMYWRTLLRYIGHNPVQAGLCKHPFDYPYGSARHFMGRTPPRWLDRGGVERRLGMMPQLSRPMDYAEAIRAPLSNSELELIERRMARPRAAEDDLDALYRAPPAYLARWMARKTRAAGGHSPWIPIATPRAVLSAIASSRGAERWSVRCGRNLHDGWEVLAAGLLHMLACVSTDEAGPLLTCHPATAARRVRRHKELLLADPGYADEAGRVARAALDLTFSD